MTPSKPEVSIKKDGHTHPVVLSPIPTVSIKNLKELLSPADGSASIQKIPKSSSIPNLQALAQLPWLHPSYVHQGFPQADQRNLARNRTISKD
jgi:hypothetical protein